MKTNCCIWKWTYTNDSFVIWLMTNNKKMLLRWWIFTHFIY